MTDRPILFSAPMVQALLREIELPGSGKTQTRRLPKIKGYPGFFQFGPSDTKGYDWTFRRKDHVWEDYRHNELLKRLPYAVGDQLWVRETHFAHGHWEETGELTETGKQERRFVRVRSSEVLFELSKGLVRPNTLDNVTGWYKRPSLFLEKPDSRITLEVTDVRIERLQNISGEDCMAEGVCEIEEIVDITSNGAGLPVEIRDTRCRVPGIGDDDEGFLTEHDAFIDLWGTVNGPGAWSANPWVVAYTFKPFLCNIDQMEKAA